jgi:hypothetical protein
MPKRRGTTRLGNVKRGGTFTNSRRSLNVKYLAARQKANKKRGGK